MKTYDELLQQWNGCKGKGQILLDATHPIRMYLNINEKKNKELLIPLRYNEKRFKSTVAIGITNYENRDSKYLAIESKKDTREMYARFGIEARPKSDFI